MPFRYGITILQQRSLGIGRYHAQPTLSAAPYAFEIYLPLRRQ